MATKVKALAVLASSMPRRPEIIPASAAMEVVILS